MIVMSTSGWVSPLFGVRAEPMSVTLKVAWNVSVSVHNVSVAVSLSVRVPEPMMSGVNEIVFSDGSTFVSIVSSKSNVRTKKVSSSASVINSCEAVIPRADTSGFIVSISKLSVGGVPSASCALPASSCPPLVVAPILVTSSLLSLKVNMVVKTFDAVQVLAPLSFTRVSPARVWLNVITGSAIV